MIDKPDDKRPRQIGYAIVNAQTVQELSTQVQGLIVQGFRPLGGLAISGKAGLVGPQGIMFYQSLFFEAIIEDAPAEDTGPKLVPAS